MLSAATTEVLATCVLGGLGLLLIAWGAVLLHRLPYTTMQSLLWVWNYLMTRLLWRARVTGRISIPPGQGAIVVCNHRSTVDPSFIVLTTKRVVHWMVAKEYSVHPAFRWFLRTCEIIPVNRGGIDTAATKVAIRYARQGELVGLFPEGRINTTDQLLLPGRPGVAMIALRARVPVVPCYISGSPFDGTLLGCLLTPAAVHLKVGEPIDVSPYYGKERDRGVREDLTRRILVEMAKLAGREDFQPQLAGRFYKPGLVDE
jgi:1-acyl-sn-glycerol-3-phosphate acyltransferase